MPKLLTQPAQLSLAGAGCPVLSTVFSYFYWIDYAGLGVSTRPGEPHFAHWSLFTSGTALSAGAKLTVGSERLTQAAQPELFASD